MTTDDMHEHHRQGDTDEMTGHRMERIANSATSKVIATISVTLLPIMLTVIGWFLIAANTRIEATQASQGADIQSIKSDVRDVNTRLDAQVIRQVDSNTKHIDNLEQRVQVIERVVRTP